MMKKKADQGRRITERLRQVPRAVYGQYMIALALPLLLLSLIRTAYLLSQPGDILKIYGGMNILFGCLASVIFFAYTRHTSTMPSGGDAFRLMCAVAYGMCAYATSQESSLIHLLAFAVFPLLFLCLEQMVREGRYLRFAVAGGGYLLVDPQAGIPVMFLLFIYALLESARVRKLHFDEFLHLFVCFLFSFGMGAVRTFFYFAPMLQDQETYGYQGFQLNLSVPGLLAKFFPGVASSRSMISAVGRLDLYFGMLFLLAVLLFFCNASISSRKRGYYAVFTLILLLCVECSPLYYLFQLFRIPVGSTICFSFLIVFWLLRLSWEGLVRMNQMTLAGKLRAVLILLGTGVAAWLFSAHNFNRIALLAQLICFAVYAAVFLGWGKKLQKVRSYRICLLVLVIVELSASICLTYWKPLRAQWPSVLAQFIWKVEGKETDSKQENMEETDIKSEEVDLEAGTEEKDEADPEEVYHEFVEKHTDEEVNTLISQLSSVVTLEEEEKEKYCGTFLPNSMEYINGLCHKLGIKKELFHELDMEITFDAGEDYTVLDAGEHIYSMVDMKKNHETDQNVLETYLVPYHFSLKGEKASDLYVRANLSDRIVQMHDSEEEASGFLLMQVAPPIVGNFQAAVYRIDRTVEAETKQLVADRMAEKKNRGMVDSSLFLIDAVGVVISYLSLMVLFFLCGYNQKQKVYRVMYRAKTRIGENAFVRKAEKWMRENRIYLLAFLIPFFCYFVCMIIGDCEPFGKNLFYVDDGLVGALPGVVENYNKYQSGNKYLTMNMGYGFDLSLYYTYVLMATLYHLLPLKVAVNLFISGVGVSMGLSGWAMMYYMTHRVEGMAKKYDLCLLIPSCIYAMSAHMIAFICWPTWYFVLALFPLLMVAFERMVSGRGNVAYILLLGGCILIEIQLAMYMCIFLVLRFFLLRFHGIRDFLVKGIRFSITSLMAGGCGFLVVYRTLLGYSTGGYRAKDAQFPAPGWHGSFWEEWKKFFCLVETKAVSHNNGDLSGYCGILTLLLMVVWFVWSDKKLAEKIRRLVPIAILAVSFNGRVLSYLWNGCHYQSNVPNRYVYLLTFLLAALAYDSLDTLRRLSRRKLAYLAGVSVVITGLVYQYGEEITTVAICTTLCLITVYAMLHQTSANRRRGVKGYNRLLTGFLLAELSVNMFFLASHLSASSVQDVVGDYESHAAMVDQHLREEGSFCRGCYVKKGLYNEGELYNMGSNSMFNSFVSINQLRMQADYGFDWANNNMCAKSLSNPFGLSLAGDRYLFLEEVMHQPIYDVGRYRYLGRFNGYYLYENLDVLSLGIYAPKSLADLPMEVMNDTVLYQNVMAGVYGGTEKEMLGGRTELSYDREGKRLNSFYFYTEEGIRFKPEEFTLYEKEFNDDKVYMHITFQAPKGKMTYLYMDGFYALGEGEGEETRSVDLAFCGVTISDHYEIMTFDEEVYRAAVEEMKKNQLENVVVSNDKISGTTDYTKDGYTSYSVAYSQDWKAYIDGREVEVECPTEAGIFVKTPAGKHTVELRFVPYGLRTGKVVSLLFLCATFLYWQVERQNRKEGRKMS